jgi:hypothetical protein
LTTDAGVSGERHNVTWSDIDCKGQDQNGKGERGSALPGGALEMAANLYFGIVTGVPGAFLQIFSRRLTMNQP